MCRERKPDETPQFEHQENDMGIYSPLHKSGSYRMDITKPSQQLETSLVLHSAFLTFCLAYPRHGFGHFVDFVHLALAAPNHTNTGRFLGIEHQSHCRHPAETVRKLYTRTTRANSWHLGGGGVGAGSPTPLC